MTMEYRKNIENRPRGFTVIEVVVVLMIIGLVAAVAMSRMTSMAAFSQVSEADILKGHLRYAQYRAMSHIDPWGISFTANSYSLLYNKIPTTSILPNEESSAHTLTSGVRITTGAGTAVNFNEWGNPVDAAGVLLAEDKLIVLSDGASVQTIRITQNTGFIP